jgi:hypothetical protein
VWKVIIEVMKRILTIAALAGLTLMAQDFAAAPGRAADNRPPVVVELFTSQGCSSCPPADAFLGELAQRKDVIALAYHVDYWDYIGWKDRYASPAWTNRQKGYASSLELRSLYTPQMVIDGRADAVGSDRSNVNYLIERAASLPKLELTLDSTGGKYLLHLPEARFNKPATIWLAIYDPEQHTQVSRGENAGSTLSEYNIVRELRKVASWDGTATILDLSLEDVMGKGKACAVLVQGGDQGPILAALLVPAS